jgi:ribonuclease P protein component
MFKKENRLTKKKDFDRVFAKGVSSYNNFFGIKAVDNKLKINRYGIIVSNKINKSAVFRNRIKRAIREFIIKNEQKIIKGKDIVVIGIKSIKNFSQDDIEVSLDNGFKRLKLYSNVK